jgi:hypothetical protein
MSAIASSRSSVVPRLLCPSCGEELAPALVASAVNTMSAGMRCPSDACGQWCMANLLQPGPVLRQLGDLLGRDIAHRAARRWRLPAHLQTRRFWILEAPSRALDLLTDPREFVAALLVADKRERPEGLA